VKYRKLVALSLLALSLAAGSLAPENDGFSLKVTLAHLLRDRPGELHIGHEGLSFRSDDGKTRFDVPWRDIREADVSDARKLRFSLFDIRKWEPLERRELVFRAPPDAPVEDIARMLADRVHRPVVGHYGAASQFTVLAFHKRALHGTSGTLEIGPEAIRYVSGQSADSRTWLYRDIETIGRPDPFRFRVTTVRETYVLELKDHLPDAAFQFAWNKVYPMETDVK